MYKSHSISFLTFADSRLACKDIIKNQAEKSGFFDKIYAFDEHDLDDWYLKKYADRLVLGSRGFGYWQWKSYLVRKIMDIINEGDILVYADGGCTINEKGGKRLSDYFSIVENSESGILGFDQGWRAAEWTKGDVFAYFGVSNERKYLDQSQVAGGVFVIRKCWKSQQFIDEWFYVCHNHYNLITDEPSVFPNDKDFKENRHDQSVFSVLGTKYNIETIPVTEIFSESGYCNMQEYPIWATRYKPKKHSWLWKLYHKLK